MRKEILIFAALLAAAAPLAAGQIDNCNTMVNLSNSPMRISICPMGDFEHIREARGGTADYIRIRARDALNNPIPGIPRTDYWLDACDPAQALCLCCQPVIADAKTDIDGIAFLCGPIAGGGCVLTQGIYIMVQGQIIMLKPLCVQPVCLSIVVVSPDLNADCVVNLSDFAAFSMAYNKIPPTDPCCDYNDDGYCNLSDFAAFGIHYHHACR